MFELDGHLARITQSTEITRGMVLRMVDVEPDSKMEVIPTFSDMLVLDTYWRDSKGVQLAPGVKGASAHPSSWCILLARPYGSVSLGVTRRPGAALGCEEVEVTHGRLCAADSRFRVVLNSRGFPASHIT